MSAQVASADHLRQTTSRPRGVGGRTGLVWAWNAARRCFSVSALSSFRFTSGSPVMSSCPGVYTRMTPPQHIMWAASIESSRECMRHEGHALWHLRRRKLLVVGPPAGRVDPPPCDPLDLRSVASLLVSTRSSVPASMR